jgi:hypothetical protein
MKMIKLGLFAPKHISPSRRARRINVGLFKEVIGKAIP